MMKCPYCQEEIKEGALVCKHCGRDFSVLLHVVEQVERIRAEAVEEANSVRRRLDTVEAQLIAAHQPGVATWKPMVLIAGTGVTVALAHWLYWETSNHTVEDVMSVVSLALAPLIAMLVGLARPGRTWKTYPLMGGAAGLGMLGAEWIQVGVTFLESLMIFALVVMTASAAGLTGRWLRQFIDFLRAPGSLERAESGVTRLTKLTQALKPLVTAAVAVIPLTAGIIQTRGEAISLQSYDEKRANSTEAGLTPSFIADQLIRNETLYPLQTVEAGGINLEEFVDEYGDTHFFQEDMESLESMGLITVSGRNYAAARLTERGQEVLNHINITQSSVQQLSQSTEFPPLDGLPTVTLGAGTSVSGLLEFPVHRRLEITEAGRYIVAATSDDDGDAVLEIWDGDDVSLGYDDDSGTGVDARLACVLAPGTYRILVDRIGVSGSFTLTVDLDSAGFVDESTRCSRELTPDFLGN